jgi:hypothetical protein
MPVNGSFTNQMTYSTGTGPASVAVSDFNNDTQLDLVLIDFGDYNNDTIPDIIVANFGNSKLDALLGHTIGTFASIILFSMKYGSRPFAVVAGDFNSNRRLNFAVVDNSTDSLIIFLQTC